MFPCCHAFSDSHFLAAQWTSDTLHKAVCFCVLENAALKLFSLPLNIVLFLIDIRNAQFSLSKLEPFILAQKSLTPGDNFLRQHGLCYVGGVCAHVFLCQVVQRFVVVSWFRFHLDVSYQCISTTVPRDYAMNCNLCACSVKLNPMWTPFNKRHTVFTRIIFAVCFAILGPLEGGAQITRIFCENVQNILSQS